MIQQVFRCATCQRDYHFVDERKDCKDLQVLPDGWYSVLIGPLYQTESIHTLVFCSISCLHAYSFSGKK